MLRKLLISAALVFACATVALANVGVVATAIKSGSGTSQVLTVPTPGAGHFQIFVVRAGQTPTPPSGPTVVATPSGSGLTTVYSCSTSTCSGNSYTFTFGTSTSAIICYAEFSGTAASPIITQKSKNNGTASTSVTSPGILTTYNSDYVLSYFTSSSGPTSFTDTAGFTNVVSNIQSGQSCVMNALQQTVGAYAADSGTWGAAVAGQSGTLDIIPSGALRACAGSLSMEGFGC